MPDVNTVVVGIGFIKREAKEALAKLAVGDALELQRENHPRDRNAIKVRFHYLQVGYVPRAVNSQVAQAMDSGAKPLACCIAPPRFTDKGFCKTEPKIRISW